MTPIHVQGIALVNVGIAVQGQEVDVVVNDALGLSHHLTLAYPQRCGGHGDGKIVDLDAIELIDTHLDGIDKGIEGLHVVDELDHLVLEPSQRQVGLGEKIARAARGVEKNKRGQLVLKFVQSLETAFKYRLVGDVGQLALEAIEKQRVDHLVYVFDRGIVHAARPTGDSIEGALKHATKDGGRNLRPVEVERCMLQQHLPHLLGKRRHVDLLGKEPAIGVREGGQVGTQILAATLDRGVERVENAQQGVAHVGGLILVKIVVKHVVPPKNAGILGIEAEHQSHAQNVEIPHRARVGQVILLDERIIHAAHNLASLHAHFHFLVDVDTSRVDEKLQAVVVVAQIDERDVLRLAVGVFHIVDVDFGKVASHYPARALRVGQGGRVALRLLERGEHGAIALTYGLA